MISTAITQNDIYLFDCVMFSLGNFKKSWTSLKKW